MRRLGRRHAIEILPIWRMIWGSDSQVCAVYLRCSSNWAIDNKQEMIDIIETVYRGASKGRGLVISPKDYSTRYKY